MRRHRKGKLDIHSAGITFYRRVDELFHLGKFNYLVELSVDFRLRHTEDRAVHVNILAAGQLRVKARAHFKHGRDPAVIRNRSLRRRGNARKQLQQRGFSRAVMSDYAKGFAFFHGERNIVKCQKMFARMRGSVGADFAVRIFLALYTRHPTLQIAAERSAANGAKAVFF